MGLIIGTFPGTVAGVLAALLLVPLINPGPDAAILLGQVLGGTGALAGLIIAGILTARSRP